MESPTLFIFAGLPGVGKSTIATMLARHFCCPYLRIDTIEQGIRDLCGVTLQYEGYQLAHLIAAENLSLGQRVVVDSCNPLHLTREDWHMVASQCGAAFINIEIRCSDQSEHQGRVENRSPDVPDLKLPSWQEVQNRLYHGWSHEHITIDTAGESPEQSFAKLLKLVPESRIQ